jgi:uncharacterized protein YcsI (UPF0317 family)
MGLTMRLSEGEMVSWRADFASEILAMAGKNTRGCIPGLTTEEYGSVKAGAPPQQSAG